MRYMAVLVAGLALIGCDDDDDDFDDDIDIAQRQLTTNMTGRAGYELIGGSAIVTWTQGAQQFTATAQITGDLAGNIRPWHVHFGTCATGGAIVGADAEYPRLNVQADGTATATVNVRYELGSVPYHINFHKSNADLATLIACGDLVPSGGGAGGGGGGGGY